MEISVKVTKFNDRKFWLMYYDDPLTGRRLTQSTKETSEGAARKAAGKWEAELKEGRYKPKINVTWAEFRQAFLEARVDDCKDSAFGCFVTALNAVERHLTIDRLAQLTSPRIAFLVKQLREVDKLSDETIRSYLSHVRAALNWAASPSIALLNKAPEFEMPKRARGQKLMKGRPITAEEFDRMLGKIEAGLVLTNTSRVNKNRKRQPSESAQANRVKRLAAGAAAAAKGWDTLLRGLWWSGLRLGEAVTLSWDDERYITVEMGGPRPRLYIAAGQDKSGKARLLPLAPEFAEMLLAVPAHLRHGPVFPLAGLQGERTADLVYISRVISTIGQAAGVVVDKASGKFASAHDLRRAFGRRWSSRVMPADLMKLMRHASIDTTMKYYADSEASDTEDAVYSAMARVNTFVNSQVSDVQKCGSGVVASCSE
jgi:integrase